MEKIEVKPCCVQLKRLQISKRFKSITPRHRNQFVSHTDEKSVKNGIHSEGDPRIKPCSVQLCRTTFRTNKKGTPSRKSSYHQYTSMTSDSIIQMQLAWKNRRSKTIWPQKDGSIHHTSAYANVKAEGQLGCGMGSNTHLETGESGESIKIGDNGTGSVLGNEETTSGDMKYDVSGSILQNSTFELTVAHDMSENTLRHVGLKHEVKTEPNKRRDSPKKERKLHKDNSLQKQGKEPNFKKNISNDRGLQIESRYKQDSVCNNFQIQVKSKERKSEAGKSGICTAEKGLYQLTVTHTIGGDQEARESDLVIGTEEMQKSTNKGITSSKIEESQNPQEKAFNILEQGQRVNAVANVSGTCADVDPTSKEHGNANPAIKIASNQIQNPSSGTESNSIGGMIYSSVGRSQLQTQMHTNMLHQTSKQIIGTPQVLLGGSTNVLPYISTDSIPQEQMTISQSNTNSVPQTIFQPPINAVSVPQDLNNSIIIQLPMGSNTYYQVPTNNMVLQPSINFNIGCPQNLQNDLITVIPSGMTGSSVISTNPIQNSLYNVVGLQQNTYAPLSNCGIEASSNIMTHLNVCVQNEQLKSQDKTEVLQKGIDRIKETNNGTLCMQQNDKFGNAQGRPSKITAVPSNQSRDNCNTGATTENIKTVSKSSGDKKRVTVVNVKDASVTGVGKNVASSISQRNLKKGYSLRKDLKPVSYMESSDDEGLDDDDSLDETYKACKEDDSEDESPDNNITRKSKEHKNKSNQLKGTTCNGIVATKHDKNPMNNGKISVKVDKSNPLKGSTDTGTAIEEPNKKSSLPLKLSEDARQILSNPQFRNLPVRKLIEIKRLSQRKGGGRPRKVSTKGSSRKRGCRTNRTDKSFEGGQNKNTQNDQQQRKHTLQSQSRDALIACVLGEMIPNRNRNDILVEKNISSKVHVCHNINTATERPQQQRQNLQSQSKNDSMTCSAGVTSADKSKPRNPKIKEHENRPYDPLQSQSKKKQKANICKEANKSYHQQISQIDDQELEKRIEMLDKEGRALEDKWRYMYGEEETFKNLDDIQKIWRLCVFDDSESFKQCFKYVEWNCYMRCIHCDKIFEKFAAYLLHSFRGTKCSVKYFDRQYGTGRVCFPCNKTDLSKYGWIRHMLKLKCHGEKKSAYIPKLQFLDRTKEPTQRSSQSNEGKTSVISQIEPEKEQVTKDDIAMNANDKGTEGNSVDTSLDERLSVDQSHSDALFQRIVEREDEWHDKFEAGFQCKACTHTTNVFLSLIDAVSHIKKTHLHEEEVVFKYRWKEMIKGKEKISVKVATKPREVHLCFVCGLSIKGEKENLLRHLVTVHKDVPPEELGIEDKIILCPHCGKTFSVHNRSRFNIHKMTHSGPVTCKKCDKTFKHRLIYLRHAKKHRDPIFKCKKCGKKFEERSQFAQHKHVHKLNESERKHKCEICDKAFMFRHHLANHSVVHSTDRKFQCAHCEMTFKLKHHLKNHLERACSRKKRE